MIQHRTSRTSTTCVTQCLFLKFSELQVRVDGVGATSRHRDAVDVAVRESTRRVREPRPCRDGVVPAQGIHVVVDPKAERLQIAERAELESLREMVRLLKSEGGWSQPPDEVRVLQKALTKAEKNHRKDTALLRKTIDTLQAKNDLSLIHI